MLATRMLSAVWDWLETGRAGRAVHHRHACISKPGGVVWVGHGVGCVLQFGIDEPLMMMTPLHVQAIRAALLSARKAG